MKKLAIKHGDNDWQRTFEGVLDLVKIKMLRGGEFAEKKEFLCDFINTISHTAAIIYQMRSNNTLFDNVVKYIQVAPSQIFIDKEVDTLVSEIGTDGNLEIAVFDSTLHNNQIYSI